MATIQTDTPAQWLLSQFEETDPAYIQVYDEDLDELVYPYCVEPMFSLKSDLDFCESMRVIKADYADSGGRFL